jgi:peptidoglycan hydrolase-like protein with peptidoglycan-binding domain
VTTDNQTGVKSTDVDFKATGPQSDYNSPLYKDPAQRPGRPLDSDSGNDGYEIPHRVGGGSLKTLTPGSKGDTNSVASAQEMLTDDLGVQLGSGRYDAPTVAAVKKYQKAHGLQVDGIIGRQTWASLISKGKYKLPAGRVEGLGSRDFPTASRQRSTFKEPYKTQVPNNSSGGIETIGAHNRGEHEDQQAASPMHRAMDQTERTAVQYQAALESGDKKRIRKAEGEYAAAIVQQARLAGSRARAQGANDQQVQQEIDKQIEFAATFGGNTDREAAAVVRSITPYVHKNISGQSRQTLDKQIAQYDTALLFSQAADQQATIDQAAQDADRVQALQGYGGGYVMQAALKDAAGSSQEAARSREQLPGTLDNLYLNLSPDAQAANIQLRKAKENLSKAQDPKARDTAQKAYDKALTNAQQANAALTQIDAQRNGLALDGQIERLQQAQQAYDKAKGGFVQHDPNAVNYRSGVYTNGYDPTATLTPPDDFGPVVTSRDGAATGKDGTHTIGTDSWQLDPEHNGPIVTRVSPGEYRVSNLQYYTAEINDDLLGPGAPDAHQNGQKMNATTAALWEANYQAANADRDFQKAQQDTISGIIGADGRPITLNTKTDRHMYENGTVNYGDNTPQAKLPEDIAKWQSAARSRVELQAGITPDGRAASQAQLDAAAEREHDAYLQMAASNAGLADDLARQNQETAQERLDGANEALRDSGVTGLFYSQVPAAGVRSFLQQPRQQAALDAQRNADEVYGAAVKTRQDTAAASQRAQDQALLGRYLSDDQMYLEPTIQSDLLSHAIEDEARQRWDEENPVDRWDAGLNAIGGGLEVLGGAALFAGGTATDATVVGAPVGVAGQVAGGAVVADGALRTGHGLYELFTGRHATPPVAWAAERLGVDPETAARIDAGVGTAGMLAGGGFGLAKGGLKAAQAGLTTGRGARAAGGMAANVGLMSDFTAPTAYYAATGNEPWTPLSVQGGTAGLHALGMSRHWAEISANYGLMIGGPAWSIGRGIAGRRGGNASGAQPRIPITLARGGSTDPAAIPRSLFGEPAGGSDRIAIPRLPDGPTSPRPAAKQPVAARPPGRSRQEPTRPPGRPGQEPARSPGRPARAAQERPSVTPRAHRRGTEMPPDYQAVFDGLEGLDLPAQDRADLAYALTADPPPAEPRPYPTMADQGEGRPRRPQPETARARQAPHQDDFSLDTRTTQTPYPRQQWAPVEDAAGSFDPVAVARARLANAEDALKRAEQARSEDKLSQDVSGSDRQAVEAWRRQWLSNAQERVSALRRDPEAARVYDDQGMTAMDRAQSELDAARQRSGMPVTRTSVANLRYKEYGEALQRLQDAEHEAAGGTADRTAPRVTFRVSQGPWSSDPRFLFGKAGGTAGSEAAPPPTAPAAARPRQPAINVPWRRPASADRPAVDPLTANIQNFLARRAARQLTPSFSRFSRTPFGTPLPPETMGGLDPSVLQSRHRREINARLQNIKSWQTVAARADELVARAADRPRLSPREQVLLDELTAPPGQHTGFILYGPDDTVSSVHYGTGFAGAPKEIAARTYPTIDAARKAVMESGRDTWISRNEPLEENPKTYRRETVQGSFHMKANGDIVQLGIPNPISTAWRTKVSKLAAPFIGTDPVSSKRVVATTLAARLAMGHVGGLHGLEWYGKFGLDSVITNANHNLFDPFGMDKYAEWARPGNKGPVSTAGFVAGGLRRTSWLVNSRGGSRVVLSYAARGTPEGRARAFDQMGRRLSNTRLRGVKPKEPAAAAKLMEELGLFADRAIDFRKALESWGNGPSMRDFGIWDIRPSDQTHFVPRSWQKAAGLRGREASDFIVVTEARFKRGEPGALTSRPADTRAGVDELLVRLDRMDEQTLQGTIDQARAGNPTTPEAYLLRDFPGLQDRLLQSAPQRAEVRRAHEAMFDALWDMTGKKIPEARRPQKSHFVPKDVQKAAGLRSGRKVRPFIEQVEADFPRGSHPEALTGKTGAWEGLNELLGRLDRMDEQTLRGTIDKALAGNTATPEARLLQTFPGLQDGLINSLTDRAAERTNFEKLYGQMPPQGRPQAVGIEEKAMGTPTDPVTTTGRMMRQGALSLSLLGAVNWAVNKMPADFSIAGLPVGGMFDAILGYSAWTAIKYGDALDARARFQKEHTQEEIAANPELQARETELQEAVKSAKDWQNSASLVALFRSLGSAGNYWAQGLPVMAGMKLIQATTTAAWILARWPELPAKMVSKSVNLASRGKINLDYERMTPSFLMNMPEKARTAMMISAAAGMIGIPIATAAMTYDPRENSYYNTHVTPDKEYVDSLVSQLWNLESTAARIFLDPTQYSPFAP